MREKKNIPIEKIVPNNHQPRQDFSSDNLFELAQSIRVNGLLQPIIVRHVGDKYEIIAGERRYRASILAGQTEIEAIIDEADTNLSAQLALIENIQREDLNVIEQARAFQEIMTTQNLTQQKISEMVGKSQSSIANKVRLLKLPEPIIDSLLAKDITERHGRALLKANPEVIAEAHQTILKRQLSVKASEELIDRLNNKKKPKINLSVYSRQEKLAINTIQQAVKMVKDTGMKVDIEKSETDEVITMNITIKKSQRGS